MEPTEQPQPAGGQNLDRTQQIIIVLIVIVVLLLGGLLLARCGDDTDTADTNDQQTLPEQDDTEPTTTEAPTTTAEAPTTTATPTTEAPATTTTETPGPVFDCTLAVKDGKLAGLTLGWDEIGTEITTAVAAITALCGPPDRDTGWYFDCLLDVSWDQASDEKPLRLIEWGGLELTFRRGYTVEWVVPPTVDSDGYPITSPDPPGYGPATYTDSGWLARWNYYGSGSSEEKQVEIVLKGGSIGDPMSEVMATLSLDETDVDEYAFDAFGIISVWSDEGMPYLSQIGVPYDNVAEAIENSTLTSIGWIQYCH
jgi:hypothetical protein